MAWVGSSLSKTKAGKVLIAFLNIYNDNRLNFVVNNEIHKFMFRLKSIKNLKEHKEFYGKLLLKYTKESIYKLKLPGKITKRPLESFL